MRTKLTRRVVGAAPRDKTTYLWDTELKGFGCKVSPTAISWLVQKFVGGRGGKARRVVIGRYPPMELQEAQKKASLAIGQLANGTDLVANRKQQRRAIGEELRAPTLENTVQLYVGKCSTGTRYWREIEATFNNYVIPQLGPTTAVRHITEQDIRGLIEQKEAKGTKGAARNVY